MSQIGADVLAALMWPVYDLPVLMRAGPFDMAKIIVVAELGVALAFPVFGVPLKHNSFMKDVGDLAFGYLAAAAISFFAKNI